ncbi:hypothetical protein BSD967_07555 [Bifidobacterium saguini]|uniref:Uncharacterized protein n=1 Tax=Bifidobacterium saguini TaxID=762210 RepID=A0ABX7SAL0_9BIFI|nr:hypothetical protein [Bifidobacterium saguini]QTB90204.1 hypothetical protein BSD967_07555 [Bifidobacterium saguini]
MTLSLGCKEKAVSIVEKPGMVVGDYPAGNDWKITGAKPYAWQGLARLLLNYG